MFTRSCHSASCSSDSSTLRSSNAVWSLAKLPLVHTRRASTPSQDPHYSCGHHPHHHHQRSESPDGSSWAFAASAKLSRSVQQHRAVFD
ncbi:hypothetical protein DIPPA_28775 [Diplonema papillatum]|nr:hypothetical protein DIPPA_28775 [Diplonema papillatum]